MKRIIITERQKNLLIKLELNEVSDYDILVKNVISDLKYNYDITVGTYRQGGEYYEKSMVNIKADGTTITPKELFKYLRIKNKRIGDELLGVIITDWLAGKVTDGYRPSKNTPLT